MDFCVSHQLCRFFVGHHLAQQPGIDQSAFQKRHGFAGQMRFGQREANLFLVFCLAKPFLQRNMAFYRVAASFLCDFRAYLRSLLSLGFQAILITICVGIYAVLVDGFSRFDDNISAAIWSCMGYTVLLCYTLFQETCDLTKSLFGAHKVAKPPENQVAQPVRDIYFLRPEPFLVGSTN